MNVTYEVKKLNRPYRAKTCFCFIPKALPWAVLNQPFGLGLNKVRPKGAKFRV